jgi:hypothetical protein
MITTLALVATHLVAVGAGAFGWPHISTLYASYTSSKAVSAAKALVAKAEADAAALVAAKAVVASQPTPAAPAAAPPAAH